MSAIALISQAEIEKEEDIDNVTSTNTDGYSSSRSQTENKPDTDMTLREKATVEVV